MMVTESAVRREPSGEAGPLSFARWRRRLIAAEQGTGWLDQCDDAGRFLVISRELVDALAQVLRRLAEPGPVLEVCAGDGRLALQLAAAGIRVQATDAQPAASGDVLPLTAAEALRRFQPAVVLGSFVPFDAGVDEAVLRCSSVRHYLILNARIGGAMGSPALWADPNWHAQPLPNVRRWMLTRHDVWLGETHSDGPVLQHGEAWHLTRQTGEARGPESFTPT
jgi:hypothetical protein